MKNTEDITWEEILSGNAKPRPWFIRSILIFILFIIFSMFFIYEDPNNTEVTIENNTSSIIDNKQSLIESVDSTTKPTINVTLSEVLPNIENNNQIVEKEDTNNTIKKSNIENTEKKIEKKPTIEKKIIVKKPLNNQNKKIDIDYRKQKKESLICKKHSNEKFLCNYNFKPLLEDKATFKIVWENKDRPKDKRIRIVNISKGYKRIYDYRNPNGRNGEWTVTIYKNNNKVIRKTFNMK